MLSRLPRRSWSGSISKLRTIVSTRTLATSVCRADHKAYSATLLLPKTSLPLKHKDPVAAEHVYRSRTTDELYKSQWSTNKGELFVLHDGPPYANGHLHMGHALNKILKDIISRYQVLRGRQVHYVPGWDCHGLPIEQKALKAIGKKHTAMSVSAVRATARSTAAEAIEIQKEEFRSLAVMADWDSSEGVYITMKPEFEMRQMRLFQRMVQQGHVTYRLRPTYYSPSSRTALAESELKYEDGHKSRSVYVGFDVEKADMSDGLREAYDQAVTKAGELPLRLAVWTTTAWTLPANLGVNVGAEMTYSIVLTRDRQMLVIADSRRQALSEKLGPLETLALISGPALSGTRYTHPFHPSSTSGPRPIVFVASHVTDQSGTGLVHSAPAHGHEDYLAFQKAGLLPDKLRCPVNDDGCFTEELADWSEGGGSLVGKSVLGDGVGAVVDLYSKRGILLAEETIEHRYPLDWKTKEPIIVRATPQWFADVEAIKPRAMEALNDVAFFPPQSRNRLEAFVTSRSEWCISRQRSWGVPIPALYTSAGEPIVDDITIGHIIEVLTAKGTDHWWAGPIEDFIPPHLKGQDLTKGPDTLDVWFDSGSSWTLLESEVPRPNQPLADVYLEGSDQHRGWFQSSLLTKLGMSHDEVQAPYASIISHGFVMDEDGQKMSKSLGNGLSPVEVTVGTQEKPGQGADTLRTWAASVDYTRDVSIGPSAIKHASETLRKIRSAMRFLLANAEDIELDSVQLSPIDRYVLHELSTLELDAVHHYDTFAFNRVLNATTSFLSSTMSAFYFDTVKDTLYCESANDPRRRAAAATLRQASLVVRKIIAPIAPHLAEELYEHDGHTGSSVFLDTWSPSTDWRDPALAKDMGEIMALRSVINQLGEEVKVNAAIKSMDETVLTIFAEGEGLRILEAFHDDLPAIFGISSVSLGDTATVELGAIETTLGKGQVRISLSRSSKTKCGRCWKHTAEGQVLCARCSTVLLE